ncbi:MAG: energy transducer TonB [Dysgonomonas sp.]
MRTTLFIVLVFCFTNMAAQIKFTPDTVRSIDISELKEVVKVEEREEMPFVSTEQKPEFVGGKEAFQKFVDKNLKYKKEYRSDTLVTEVIVRFVVEKTGVISNSKILKGDGTTLAKNVLRVVDKMPKWISGARGGMLVRFYYTVRFWYDIKSQNVIIQCPILFHTSTGDWEILD